METERYINIFQIKIYQACMAKAELKEIKLKETEKSQGLSSGKLGSKPRSKAVF